MQAKPNRAGVTPLPNSSGRPSLQSAPTRVVIFNDHPVFRSTLWWKLAPSEGIEVVADAVSLGEVLTGARENDADAIVADLRIGDGNSEGISSTETIVKRSEGVPVIVCTDFHFRAYIKKLVGAGATAVLPKSATAAELAFTIADAVELAGSQHEVDRKAA